jgi:EAL domain-containing protein (putative c-di-GMP-specific phosphodiesterase class I)
MLENTSLNDKEKAVMSENLTSLKEKGIALLLDDFGSGYTSLSDLAEFDVSIVKIDKTITQNTGNEKGFLLLSNMIRTAKDLGFRTLCEGVETEEQKRLAAEAGCDLFQGYYFYRPMPVAQLKELLEAQ